MKNTTHEIRQKFLDFFKEKGHSILPGDSLIPKNDSTLLFTNAGMNQFKDFFLGKKQKNYSRIATVQNCLRTGGKHNDLENVGYTERHHTFFEMLGNFSFDDYFKKEAIMYAWELLTSKKWFNLDKNKLWISVYENDIETYKIWKNIIKVPIEKIIKIGDKNNIKYNSDNFWQMGNTGPCGPSTEIFYQFKIDYTQTTQELFNNNNCLLEIWNIVFIEFNRISNTEIIPLAKKSIDTGMGLERIASVLQNVNSNYKIDIFQELIKKISYFSNIENLNNISLKIVADHIRAIFFLISEDITPSNEHRGYILRRIIRRTLRHAYKIGINQNFFYKIIPKLIKLINIPSGILKEKEKIIQKILKKEELQFSQTLNKGLKILNQEVKKISNNIISGKTAFYLYDTFGFPIDLTKDICRERGIKIDLDDYNKYKNEQKKQSNIRKKFYKNYNQDIIINDRSVFCGYKKNRIKSLIKYIFVENKAVSSISENQLGIIFLDKTCFYPESGGQIGDIGKLYFKKTCFLVENTQNFGNMIGHIGKVISGTIKEKSTIYCKIDKIHRNSIQLNHSATHLLHAALQKILGNNALQKGSLVSNTHLRFDFSYTKNINFSQIHKIENVINEEIRNNHLIKTKNLNIEEAKRNKAIALFDHKYNNIVRVVFIKDFSIELCGGTHTNRTGKIGIFKIIGQSNVSSGIKRIEALTGQYAINYLHYQDTLIKDISLILKSNNSDIQEKIKNLILKVKNLEKKADQLQNKENTNQIKKLLKKVDNIKNIKLLTHILHKYDQKSVRIIVDQLKKELKNAIIILINKINNSYTINCGVTKNLTHSITAIDIVNIFIKETQGKGGGKKEIAEGGGMNNAKLPIIVKNIKQWITEKLKNNIF
ncbi:alanine--tRNA ligase [Buchnera aphidicola (Melanaphis sacchari)]|uniref:Alanine--tRNA ligase n=1 Tax=Buchnera aphidicola (Melanaphis sacchari) TaxID=2173854 RepID=A0A2U8DF73_9GAMM|nr:alanine--tRNA ligase [Buchnera aphidicola]AWH90393.1 alanine--tRNA ligase [Buchnera aphidicola (Melanaphis sacchari)]